MEPERTPQPTVFVLFGAGGDLSRRLIVPALFNLYVEHHLPEHFLLIGVGRGESSDEALAEHYRQGRARRCGVAFGYPLHKIPQVYVFLQESPHLLQESPRHIRQTQLSSEKSILFICTLQIPQSVE